MTWWARRHAARSGLTPCGGRFCRGSLSGGPARRRRAVLHGPAEGVQALSVEGGNRGTGIRLRQGNHGHGRAGVSSGGVFGGVHDQGSRSDVRQRRSRGSMPPEQLRPAVRRPPSPGRAGTRRAVARRSWAVSRAPWLRILFTSRLTAHHSLRGARRSLRAAAGLRAARRAALRGPLAAACGPQRRFSSGRPGPPTPRTSGGSLGHRRGCAPAMPWSPDELGRPSLRRPLGLSARRSSSDLAVYSSRRLSCWRLPPSPWASRRISLRAARLRARARTISAV